MERQTAFPVQQTAIRESTLATNKVLRNTYLLLSATLAFSATMAGISLALGLPHPGIAITLIVYFALLFAVHKTANSAWGLVSVFALTGFMGYTLGPIIGYLPAGDSEWPCRSHERFRHHRRCFRRACRPTRSAVGGVFRS